MPARIAKMVANNKKKKLANRYAAKRAELKKKLIDENLSADERAAAMFALQRLPRNSSPVRIRNRCELTGRSRAYYRAFKLSRIALREYALRGMLPGVTKSSW